MKELNGALYIVVVLICGV